MTPKLRSALFAAAGFAVGIGAASVGDRPNPTPEYGPPSAALVRHSPGTLLRHGEAQITHMTRDNEVVWRGAPSSEEDTLVRTTLVIDGRTYEVTAAIPPTRVTK